MKTTTTIRELRNQLSLLREQIEDLEMPKFNSPASVAVYLWREMTTIDQEEFFVLSLDTRLNLMSNDLIYRGSVNQSPIRIVEVFRPAIVINAVQIIIAHSHPSGNPTPSPDDIRVTQAIIEAGVLLDIDVIDHLIIGATGDYYSFKENRIGGF